MTSLGLTMITEGLDNTYYSLYYDIMKYARTALITGITGQDGSYLAEFLLSKGV